MVTSLHTSFRVVRVRERRCVPSIAPGTTRHTETRRGVAPRPAKPIPAWAKPGRRSLIPRAAAPCAGASAVVRAKKEPPRICALGSLATCEAAASVLSATDRAPRRAVPCPSRVYGVVRSRVSAARPLPIAAGRSKNTWTPPPGAVRGWWTRGTLPAAIEAVPVSCRFWRGVPSATKSLAPRCKTAIECWLAPGLADRAVPVVGLDWTNPLRSRTSQQAEPSLP